jgi:hypothetical protein
MFSAGCSNFDAQLFIRGEQFSWKTRCRPGSPDEFIFYSPVDYDCVSLHRQAALAVDFIAENLQSLQRLASLGVPMDITLFAAMPYCPEVQDSLIGVIQIPRSLSKHAADCGIGVNVRVFARMAE